MNRATLVWRSLLHHRRSHVGTLLGAAIAAAVLVGSLLVGDSVRAGLAQAARARLGQVRLAAAVDERSFRAALADDLARALAAPVAPVLRLPGTVLARTSGLRANRVQVLGIDDRFWRLSTAAAPPERSSPDQVWINRRMAEQTRLGPGDEMLLRVRRPSALPTDAPLADAGDASVAWNVVVAGVVADDHLGRFALAESQVVPASVFISRATLSEKVGLPGRANMLLVGGGAEASPTSSPQADAPTPQAANAALAAAWTLDDAELELTPLEGRGEVELRSRRIFLDDSVIAAASAASRQARAVLTYLVNDLRAGERRTPYSMVSAVGPLSGEAGLSGAAPPAATPPPPGATTRPDAGAAALAALGAGQIAITAWLAEDLALAPGDAVELAFFVAGPTRRIEERTASFKVAAVLPDAGAHDDPTLMPAFPGLDQSDNCRDWRPGVPLDLERIRPKDEAYWDQRRGTPKAFVALAEAQAIWANAYGRLTAIRFPGQAADVAPLGRAIAAGLAPAQAGLSFTPVAAQAHASARGSVDFAGLFLGLSFFLIGSALLLTGLLFGLSLLQRQDELDTLVHLGFRPAAAGRLLLFEGLALGVLGTLAGLPLGALYTWAVLAGLDRAWRGAVGAAELHFAATWTSLALGAGLNVAAIAATLALTLRRQTLRHRSAALRAAGASATLSRPIAGAPLILAASLSLLGAAALLFAAARHEAAAAGLSLGAGAALLAAALAVIAWVIMPSARAQADGRAPAPRLGFAALAWRGLSRQPGRSMAAVALLACGTFLVVAVGASRPAGAIDPRRRDTGIGGFAFFGVAAMPLPPDLTDAKGLASLGIEGDAAGGVSLVPLRLREGDDASCLNLARARSPAVLGVDPEALAGRGAFAFASSALAPSADAASAWRALAAPAPEGEIPAIGDEATVRWSLGLGLGDAIELRDDRDRPVRLRIVATLRDSMLQGMLIIDQDRFIERFGLSAPGPRALLVDAPPQQRERTREALSRALSDQGLELTPALERLGLFRQVESTYLSIFLALGALGVGLGSVGLGAVVLRNVMERRGELALMRAVGFARGRLLALLALEHAMLALAGVGAGALAAGAALLPIGWRGGAEGQLLAAAGVVAALAVSSAAWAAASAAWAMRAPPLQGLHGE